MYFHTVETMFRKSKIQSYFCGTHGGLPPMAPFGTSTGTQHQHQQADWSDGFAVVFLIISVLVGASD